MNPIESILQFSNPDARCLGYLVRRRNQAFDMAQAAFRAIFSLLVSIALFGTCSLTAKAQVVVGQISGSINYSGSTPVTGYVAYLDISSGQLQPVVTGPLSTQDACPGGQPARLMPVNMFACNAGTLLAINTTPGQSIPTYQLNACYTPLGFVKSNGTVVVPQPYANPGLLFNSNTQALIVASPSSQQMNAAVNAVSGWSGGSGAGGTLLVSQQANQGSTAQPAPTLIAPRTAVGITSDGQTLIVLMIQGNESSYVGLENADLANLMIVLGAYYAVNLDGGGSITFIYTPTPGVTVTQPQALLNMAACAKLPYVTTNCPSLPSGFNPGSLTFSVTALDPNEQYLSAPPNGQYRPVPIGLGLKLVTAAKKAPKKAVRRKP